MAGKKKENYRFCKEKNERYGYSAQCVLEEKGFILTFVLRNAVSSTSPSSRFSVLKTFQHIREMKKVKRFKGDTKSTQQLLVFLLCI